MSIVTLANLLTELPETTRNSTTGALDNRKRTRGINRTLQSLQNHADWKPTMRTIEFEFIEGLKEYSLKNYIGATCFDNDGVTVIPDFKSPYDLRFTDSDVYAEFDYLEPDEVLRDIRLNRDTRKYTIDQDLLHINYSGVAAAILHPCDSLTALGSVAVSGNASNLTLDEQVFEEGSGSFNFDLSGTSAILTINLSTPLNLSTLENKAFLTFFLDLPTITAFTSVKARFGSSATDYWERTETTPANKASLAWGRSKWAFKWAGATQTGTPLDTAIDYIQITLTFSGATVATDFRIDDIRMSGSKTMEIEYFSQAMVKDENGAYQLEFNADDVTNTDELVAGEFRKVVVTGATYECFKMIGGKSERDRTDAFSEFTADKKDTYKRIGYRLRRPSRVLNFPGHH